MAIATYSAVLGALVALLAFLLPDPGRSELWKNAARSPVLQEGPLHLVPTSSGTSAVDDARDRALIEAHPVCVASRVWSSGEMSDTVYYRYRRDGERLTVGYFVHWSTERPWGKNFLTYSVVPALLVDAVYSHGLFVLPGARDFMYGPGDVEGASVTYYEEPSGALVPASAQAEDGTHGLVTLESRDLDAGGRTALVTEVWSHQLGARGAARDFERSEALHGKRCFSGESLRPLTEAVTSAFELGTPEAPLRAKPAWRLDRTLL